jgi:dienelactone hydrolase
MLKTLIVTGLLFFTLSSHAFFKDEIKVQDPVNNSTVYVTVQKVTKTEPGPTIILAHTCAGIIHKMDVQGWAYTMSSWGYNVVVPDSFVPRGYRSGICTNTKVVSEVQRAEDINRVAEWVTKQPWHRGKIGLIGFSHGGKTVMEVVNRTDTKISAAVAYYPWCTPRDTSPKVPTQIHIGDLDDWTPSNRCERVKENYELYVYKGAYHSFDREAPSRVREGNNGSQHKLVYDPVATSVSEGRTREFFKQNLK